MHNNRDYFRSADESSSDEIGSEEGSEKEVEDLRARVIWNFGIGRS